MRKIIFVVPPNVELLDFAGPFQVFREAMFQGLKIDLKCYAFTSEVTSAGSVTLGGLDDYQKSNPQPGDFIFIPGPHMESLKRPHEAEKLLYRWLQQCDKAGVTICSVCTAAFILGEAGLLDNRPCTTHWRSTDILKKRYPKAKVLDNVLFTKSDNIYTSAGVTSGIDMALDIIESLEGPMFAHAVAHGLVIYQRRSSEHQQQSVYQAYRNHIDPKIHKVQDYVSKNVKNIKGLDELASLVAMSSRNLTRVFKSNTGITIAEYTRQIRVEKAKTLAANPNNTFRFIAAECGFKSSRQLQRILKAI